MGYLTMDCWCRTKLNNLPCLPYLQLDRIQACIDAFNLQPSVSIQGNVLLLRNNLNLSSGVAEVSQEKLLSLVADRLIDSNNNANNKDAGYVENQQQNIADAIDLLPRFTTGIDVNIKFMRFDDFEFTRECAVFDLLDIPLYHGWIVDPQVCSLSHVNISM